MPSRSTLFASAVVTIAFAQGCSKNEITAESLVPPQPVPTVTATASTAPPPKVDDGPLPAPVPLEIANDEKSAPVLGQACASGAHCGTKGRIAVRAFMRGFGPAGSATPCKLTSLSAPGPRVEMEEASACVEGGRLFVESRCVMCRIDRRTSVEAEIAELTPQQLSNLQKLVAYTGEALRSPSAWQVAIAEAPKKPRSVPN